MSELNDIKVDNEEFWWEALDDFASDDEITVVEISRDDLDNNSTDGLKALGQVDMRNINAVEYRLISQA